MSKSESCTILSTFKGHLRQNQAVLSLSQEQDGQFFVHIVNLLIYRILLEKCRNVALGHPAIFQTRPSGASTQKRDFTETGILGILPPNGKGGRNYATLHSYPDG